MDKVVVFLHVAMVNNYQEIFEEIVTEIVESKLIDRLDFLKVCVVGSGNLMIPENKNIIIDFDPIASTDPLKSFNYGEFYTLTKLKQYVNELEENVKILYCHLRGVTNPNNECISTWRKYLVHHNITNHMKCLEALEDHDACGVDLITDDVWPYANHFSGNFWWANSDYLKTLPQICDIDNPSAPQKATLRHNAEFWIGMSKANLKSLFNSSVDIRYRHLNKCPSNHYQ